MNINEVYSGNYLKADDLAGKRVTVRINHVSIKDFDGDKGVERKIIVGFEGKEKCLVCNKTNATIIADVLGSQNTEDWIGGTIKLESRKVEFSGRLVPAIRVVLEEGPSGARRPAPAVEQPAQPHGNPKSPVGGTPDDDNVPF